MFYIFELSEMNSYFTKTTITGHTKISIEGSNSCGPIFDETFQSHD